MSNATTDLPAFPTLGPLAATGLTKRELFAAMAMQGILAHTRDVRWVMPPEQVAKLAVQHAAAEREALEHAPAAEETPASQQWPCINWPCQLPSGHQGPSVSSAESEEPSHG